MEKAFELIDGIEKAFIDIVSNDCDLCLAVIDVEGAQLYNDCIEVFATNGNEYTFIGTPSFFEGENGQGVLFESSSLSMSIEPAP